MKRFLIFILTLITLYIIFQDQHDVIYIGVQKAFENDKGKTEWISLDNTGRNFSTDKELPAEMTIIMDNNYWMKLICGVAIVGLLLACVFAFLFHWDFEPAVVMFTSLFVCCFCMFVLIMNKKGSITRAMTKTIYEMKGDKIDAKSISTYSKDLSLNEVIELANRADFRYVTGLKNIDADSFNKAVVKVYNGKITNFNMKNTSLRAVHNGINEANYKELRSTTMSYTKMAKQIKKAYKEYNKLEKQNKKLEAKQLKEAAKNGGKKAGEWIGDALRKASDTLEPVFGDN